MSAPETTASVVWTEHERRIREIAKRLDPMAWTAHAFSATDELLRAALEHRREVSLEQAEREHECHD